MAKQSNQNGKKDNSTKAGIIAFGVTLLGYAALLPFHTPIQWLIGAGVALVVGKVVKTMATPMKGLDKAKNSTATHVVTPEEIPDEYARGIVQSGIENLNQLRLARDAVNEYVFTRRINALSTNFRKLLERVQQDPDKAPRLRKLNTYYLPTCIKLLTSYREAKAQGTSYMQISATREDILASLDKLLEATQSLYDGMVKDDITDMDIEIDVLERMLKSDGMVKDELVEDMKQSAQAAARQMAETEDAAQAATVEAATATAQQLQHGAPILQVPGMPTYDNPFENDKTSSAN